jgi:hypothetical protein
MLEEDEMTADALTVDPPPFVASPRTVTLLPVADELPLNETLEELEVDQLNPATSTTAFGLWPLYAVAVNC